jgi:HK97 family phage portal protein
VVDVEATPTGDRVKFTLADGTKLENQAGKPPKMIHIPHVVSPGRVKGISPIEQQAELVGMSLSSQEHAARFLGEGVHLTGAIETPQPLDPEQAKDLWDGFQKLHAGPRRTGRVGVLTGGASFRTLTIPPAELQFLEQMQYSDRKISSIYRVPPHMLGDVERSTSWGSGIEEQTIQFVQHTLIPIARKLEVALNHALLAGTNYELKFAFQGLLRGSVTNRAEFYTKLWQLGALSADDILALEDMPPVPAGGGGDLRYVPLNFTPAGAAGDLEPAALANALARRVVERLLLGEKGAD